MRFVQASDYKSAERCFQRAVDASPRDPDLHALLGNALLLGGRAPAAELEYRRALALAPDHAMSAINLARVLRESGRCGEALDHLVRVLDRTPANDEALRGLTGLVGGSIDAAHLLEVADSAVIRAPSCARGHAVLGYLRLKIASDPGGALHAFDAAIALGGGDADTHGNRGIALQDLGRVDEALAAYDAALSLAPSNPVIRWHRALALLLLGRYEEGWADYDLRLLSADRPTREFPQRRWSGQPLQDKTILVHAEQGLGDEIMFASCFGELIEAAGHCLIECNPKLESIFRRSFPRATVRAGSQSADLGWLADYPKADFHCPAGSLPAILRRTRDSFPAHQGYLSADPVRVERWRRRLLKEGKRTAVGLSWRGGTRVSRAAMRSMTLEQCLPLLDLPDVLWVSVQYDADEREVSDFARRHAIPLVHWPDAIEDYDETAALLCALDRVVSVCTAVIHLGGALGRPVSVLAPLSPEWRYGAFGERMAWYPAVRIHRQRRFGDWSYPLERARHELHANRPSETGS